MSFFLEIQNCKFIQVDTTAHLLVHMHSIADGTRFQTRIEFICLRYTESPADKKPPPMHLHFWVGLTKKILHTVAVSALLWFFYLQLYKSWLLSTLLKATLERLERWNQRFLQRNVHYIYIKNSCCCCCLLCPQGQFVAIELLSNLRFVGFCSCAFPITMGWGEDLRILRQNLLYPMLLQRTSFVFMILYSITSH